MPIYAFECQRCGHRFDELMRYEDPAPMCPSCKGETKKQIAASNFVLKGEGWYKPSPSGGEQ